MKTFRGLLILCALVGFAGCKSKSKSSAKYPAGFKTPEAALDAFQTAVKEDDFPRAVATTTVESRQAIAGALVFALSFVAAFDEEKAAEVEKIMNKHGLGDGPDPGMDLTKLGSGPAAMVRAIGSAADDPIALIEDAITLMDDASSENQFAMGTLGGLKIDGDHASGTLTSAEGEKPIEFHKSAAGWLIHIPEEEFAVGPMTGGDIAGNEGFDDFDFRYDEEDSLPPPDAITKAELEKAWKTSVDFKDRVAKEAIDEVATQCGFKLFDQPDMAEKLQQTVTVKLDSVSRLQVIEAICEQIGLYPRYKLKTIAFAEGPRPYPVAFAGPFLIEVKKLTEHVPYAAGDISFEFIAAGIPTDVASQLVSLRGVVDDDSDKAMTLRFEPFTGDDQQLMGTNSGGTMKQGSKSAVVFGLSYTLKNLLRSVQQIEPIKGQISWPFPSKVATLTFKDLAPDAVASQGDVKLTLTKVQDGDTSQFTVDVQGADYGDVSVVGLDESGKPLDNIFSSSSGFDATATLMIGVDGKPKTLQARITQQRERVTYDFTIPAIPLVAYEKMPERLPELKITGDTPVIVEFVKITGNEGFRKIKVKLTNRTNKDIHSLQIKFDYMNSAGTKLRDGNGMAMGRRTLVKSGETAEVEVPAFFMPEEATLAVGRAESIEFADATAWRTP